MIHYSNSFLHVLESAPDGTSPNASYGTAFSLGASDAMGSYAQLIDGSTAWPAGIGDGYWISIRVHTVFNATANSSCLITIGIDRSGGTSYTDWIQYLSGSNAYGLSANAGGVLCYDFPLLVPHGCSLAVKGQSNNATPVATSYCYVKIGCKPTRPELVRVGTFVQVFGVDVANSKGTGITQGTTSEGAWQELGTLDKPIWYWDYGVCCTTTNLTANCWATDIGIGVDPDIRRVIRNGRIFTATSEAIVKYPAGDFGEGAIGDKVYGRMQVGDNGGVAANVASLIAYGVGG